MKTFKVDVRAFESKFPIDFRLTVASRVESTLAKTDNVEYFTTVSTYGGHHHKFPRGLDLGIDDLYASNIAVFDFLMKRPHLKNEVIVDYACGIGTVMVYLERLGFKKVCGFDNFQQIKRQTVVGFLKAHNSKATLLGPGQRKQFLALEPAVIIGGIAVHWHYLKHMSHFLGRKVPFLLTDTRYGPGKVEGYKQTGLYPTLLRVFEPNG